MQFGRKADWIRRLPCAFCGTAPTPNGQSDPMHVKSKGSGGTSKHLVPACRSCHTEQHQVGVKTFACRRGVNLAEMAREYHEKWKVVDRRG